MIEIVIKNNKCKNNGEIMDRIFIPDSPLHSPDPYEVIDYITPGFTWTKKHEAIALINNKGDIND